MISALTQRGPVSGGGSNPSDGKLTGWQTVVTFWKKTLSTY